MYSGNLYIWDYKTQALVKQVEVSAPLPVRDRLVKCAWCGMAS